MSTTRDLINLTGKLNNLGKDVFEKQQIIIEKAHKGEEKINMLKNGIIFNLSEIEINEEILNLLHYRHYVDLVQQIFLRWDEINDYSEQLYIEMGNHAKKMYEDFDEEIFDVAINELLFYKSKGDDDKIDKLLNIYLKLISKEWLDAKFLKSLKR